MKTKPKTKPAAKKTVSRLLALLLALITVFSTVATVSAAHSDHEFQDARTGMTVRRLKTTHAKNASGNYFSLFYGCNPYADKNYWPIAGGTTFADEMSAAGKDSHDYGTKGGAQWFYCIHYGPLASNDEETTANSIAKANAYWNGLSDAQRRGVMLALSCGFPNVADVYFNAEGYAATQLIIWEFTNGGRTTPFQTSTWGTSTAIRSYNGSKFKDAYDAILATMATRCLTPTFVDSSNKNVTTISTDTTTVTLKGTGYENGVLLKTGSSKPYYRFGTGASDYSSYSENLAINMNNWTVSKNGLNVEVRDTNNLYVWADAGYEGKTVSATLKRNIGGNGGWVTLAGNQELVTGVPKVDISFKLQAKVPFIPGTAKIIKTSDDGNVSGIPFTISNGTTYKEQFKTDANGVITVSLAPGRYVVHEEESDLYLPQEDQTVTVVAGQTAVVKFHNTLCPSGRITKTIINSNGEKANGTCFNLYCATNPTKTVYGKAENGKVYAADSSYTIMTPKTSTFPNMYDGTYNFRELKQDGYRLKSLTFKVDGSTIASVTLNSSGTYTTSGNITFKEVTAAAATSSNPAGYLVTGLKVTGLNDGGELLIEAVNEPEDGAIRIEKRDSTDPSKKVSGATFTYYTKSGSTYIRQGTIPEVSYGVYEKSGIAPGTYYVEETEAPPNYQRVDGYFTAVVTAGGTTEVTTHDDDFHDDDFFEESPHYGNVTLYKRNALAKDLKADAAKLSGAKFQISRTSGGSAVAYLVEDTSNKGTYILSSTEGTFRRSTGLPVGTYYIKETVAPSGYTLDTKTYSFDVYKNQTTVVNNDGRKYFLNFPKGEVTIQKIDSSGNGNVAGNSFQIYWDDDLSDAAINNQLGRHYVLNPIWTGTTDDEGSLKPSGLHSGGKFYLLETPKDGYALEKIVVTVRDKNGSIMDQGGESFTITADDYKYAQPDDRGKWEVIFREGWNGFLEFTVPDLDNGQSITIQVYNKPTSGTFEIKKQVIGEGLSAGSPEGFEFALEGKETDKTLFYAKTDSNGKAYETDSTFTRVTDIYKFSFSADQSDDYYLIEKVKPGYHLASVSIAFTDNQLNRNYDAATCEGFYRSSDPDYGACYRIPIGSLQYFFDGGNVAVTVRNEKDGGTMTIDKSVINGTGRQDEEEGFKVNLYSRRHQEYDYYGISAKAGRVAQTDYNYNLINGEYNYEFEIHDMDDYVFCERIDDDRYEFTSVTITVSKVSGAVERFYFGADDVTVNKNTSTNTTYYRTPTFAITGVNGGGNVSIHVVNSLKPREIILHKVDSLTGEPISDCKFAVYEDDKGNGQFDVGTDKYVAQMIETPEDSGTYVLGGLYGQYYLVKEMWAPAPYVPDPNYYSVKFDSYSYGDSVEVKTSGLDYFGNMPYGTFWVHKVDEDDEYDLSDAEFDIYDLNGNLVGSMGPTDATGYAKSPVLPYGTYYVVETVFPEHHPQKPGVSYQWTVVVNADSGKKDNAKELTNKIGIGKITVKKLDEKYQPLAKVYFTVRNADDPTKGCTLGPTDANGYAEVAVPYGNYVVVESKTVPGYEISLTEYKGTVSEDTNWEFSFTAVNYPKTGYIEVYKKTQDGKDLAGAVFAVYDEDGNFLTQTGETNDSGYARTSDEDGLYYNQTYTVKEIQFPDNYQPAGNQVTAIDTPAWNVMVYNFKLVLTGGKANAAYTVSRNGTVITTVTADEYGKATTDALDSGTYTVTQDGSAGSYTVTVAPAPTWSVPLNEDTAPNGFYHIDAVNALEQAQIEVLKTTPDGEKLSGAEFTIYDSNDGAIADKITTDSKGYGISKPLDMGTYRVVETKFPANCTSSGTTEWNVTLSSTTTTERIYHIDAVNYPKTGYIEVYKKTQDGKDLAGAVFAVYDKDGNFLTQTGETDDSGYARTPDEKLLEYGQTYTVKETKFPDSYQPAGNQVTAIDTPAWNVMVYNFKLVLTGGKANAAYTVSKNGTVITTVTADEYGKATTDALDSGTYTVTQDGSAGSYTVTVAPAPTWTVPINEDTAPNGFYHIDAVNALEQAQIEVLKTTPDGKKLSGAEFTIYDNNDGTIADKITTDSKGYGISKPLDMGTYRVVETKFPANCTSSGTTEWNVTLSSTTTTERIYHIDAVNIPYGSVKVIKEAEDHFKSGFKFRLYGGEIDITKTTDETGTVVFEKIPIGTYTISEVDTDIRYVVPSDQNKTVKWGEETTATFENELKKFRVVLTKTDVETSVAQGDATLKGAVYGIYKNGKLVDTYETDANGGFTTEYYDCGTDWTVKEIKPSEGYLLDPTVYPVGAEAKLFTLERNDVPVNATEQVIKGQIKLIKTYENGREPEIKPELNATFEVYLKSAGSYEKAKETERDLLNCDADGVATSKKLPYGTYVVHQITGDDSALLVADFEVEVFENEKLYSYKLHDNAVFGTVSIVKKDAETGEVIPYKGVFIQILDLTTNQLVTYFDETTNKTIDTFETDESGVCYVPVELPYGAYRVTEVRAPKGYLLNDKPVDFTVTRDHATAEVILYDKPAKGSITVEKVGEMFATVTEKDGIYQPVYELQGLEGATFEIRAAEDISTLDGTERHSKGDLVATITTGRDGKATAKDLYLGSYTITEIVAPDEMVLNTQPQTVTLTYNEETATANVLDDVVIENDRQKVSITLHKEMEKDERFAIGMDGEVENVSFGIYAAEEITAADETVIPKDGLLEVVYCNADGDAVFTTDLPINAAYYVKEVSTDDHYQVTDATYPVYFEYQGQEVAVVEIELEEVINTLIRGDISGRKLDEDGAPLAGVLFGLFRDDESVFTEETAFLTVESDENGEFSFTDIPYGSYVVRELRTADERYALNTELYPVVVDGSEEEPVEIEIVNHLIRGTAMTIKVDAEYPENRLTGATFEIYSDVDGNKEFDAEIDTLIGEMTETETGVYTRTELLYGGYFLYEKEAPKNFVKDDGYYYFEITQDGETVEVENEAGVGFLNHPVKVPFEITKTDVADGKPLPNAGFRIKDEEGNVVVEGRTDENGIATFELRVGKYTYEEFDAPKGYLIDTTPHAFEIKANDEIVKAAMTNEKAPITGDSGNIQIWLTLCFSSMAALLVLFVLRRKLREEQK